MSSDSEIDDLPPELRHNPEDIMRAKARNPGMFVSAWQADEEDIDRWTEEEVKNDPKKAFIVAAQNGRLDIVKDIITSKNEQEITEFLLASDGDGYTALHRAVYGGHAETAEFLLSIGASTETRTVDGWTPLHSAVFWNQPACVQILLEAGADCNSLTNSSQAVLHLAVANNTSSETLCYLLAQPSLNVFDVKNSAGDTPIDLLKRNTSLSHLLYPMSTEATNLCPPK